MASVVYNNIAVYAVLLACGAGFTALAYLLGDGSAQSWLIGSWLAGCTAIVGLYTFNWKHTLRIYGFYGVQNQEAALNRSATPNLSIIARGGAAGGSLGGGTILVAALVTGLPEETVVLCMISLLPKPSQTFESQTSASILNLPRVIEIRRERRVLRDDRLSASPAAVANNDAIHIDQRQNA